MDHNLLITVDSCGLDNGLAVFEVTLQLDSLSRTTTTNGITRGRSWCNTVTANKTHSLIRADGYPSDSDAPRTTPNG